MRRGSEIAAAIPGEQNKRSLSREHSGLTSDFRATTEQREGRWQLMVDRNRRDTEDTSSNVKLGKKNALANEAGVLSPPCLPPVTKTQSISHSLLIVDTLSLRDLAAMATKSRQPFFHFFFSIRGPAPSPSPKE